VSVLLRGRWVNTAGCCIVADCDCHEFAGEEGAGIAGPFGAPVTVTLTVPADEKVAEQVRRSRPSVVQLNAYLFAEMSATGWTGRANLGLGLVTTHESTTATLAILGALKLALAELEARHA
jgi:hypothetical protein